MYNAEKYVDQAVESILNSSYQQFRLICLDDGSQDATYERLLFWQEKDDRILPIRHEVRLGFEKSIKRLLSTVSSQFFFFMRPEDVVSPFFLALVEQAFQKQQPDIVFHVPVQRQPGKQTKTNNIELGNTEKIAVKSEEKSCFFKDPSLWNRIYRSKFFFDAVPFGKTGPNEETNFSSRFLNYCTILSAEKIVEIPDEIYSCFYETKSPFYDESIESEHFPRRFLSESDAIKIRFEEENCWPDYREAFFIGELGELIRQYKNLQVAFEGYEAQSSEFQNVLNSFVEIGDKLCADQKAFYSSAALPEQETFFLRNVLKIRSNDEKSRPERSIPLIPCYGKVKLFAPNHEVYCDCDLFTVLSWNVGAGYLAINALGYGNPLALPEHLTDRTQTVLSAHCPSNIRIHLKKPTCLRGVMNGTAEFSPHDGSLFYVDDRFLGRTIGPKDETRPIVLEPGFYDLRIKSLVPKGQHSLWVLSEHCDSVQNHAPEKPTTTSEYCTRRSKKVDHANRRKTFYPIGILADLQTPDIGTSLYNYALQLEAREKGLQEFIRIGHDAQHEINDGALPDHARSILKYHAEFQNEYLELSPPCETKRDFLTLLERYKQLHVSCNSHCLSRVVNDDPIFSLEDVPDNLVTRSYLRLDGEYLKKHFDDKTQQFFGKLGSIIVQDDETAEILDQHKVDKEGKAIDMLFVPIKKDWTLLSNRDIVPDNPYLFVYLTEESTDVEAFVETIKRSSSLKTVFFPSFNLSDQFVAKCSSKADFVLTGGPREFLALMENADFVLTDDYHGVAFSVIFERPFHVLESRHDPSKGPSIRSLLKELHRETKRRRFKTDFETIETEFLHKNTKDWIQKQRKHKERFTVNPIKDREPCDFEAGKPSIVVDHAEQNKPISKTKAIWNSFEYPDPDFTICIPAYNAAPFIDDAIRSVLKSTYENFKLVVSDNGSNDETAEKLQYWAGQDSRVIVLLNDQNIGVMGNVLRCAPYINTPYAAWLDADDMLSPYYMDLCKKELDEHNADAVFFQTIFIDSQGKYIGGGTKHGRSSTWYRESSEKSLLFCRPASSDKIWNKQTLSLAEYFHFKPTTSHAGAHMDVAVNMRTLAICEKVVSIPNALYYRRIHSNSITERKNDEIQLDVVEVFDVVKKDYLQWGLWDQYKELFYRFKLNHLFWLYPRLPEEMQSKLTAKLLAAMDRDERWFYRTVRLRKDQRSFVNKIWGLRDFKTIADNFYPDSKPLLTTPTIPFLDLNNGKNRTGEPYFENDLFAVHHWKVGRGRLGINDLGYGNPLSLPNEIKLISHTVLSAHCPSRIKVSFKHPVEICGFMNGTSAWSGNGSCLFRIADQSLGYLFGPGDMTNRVILPPGTFELETSGPEPYTKHSAWAIRKVSGSPKKDAPLFREPYLLSYKNDAIRTE